jgi:PAS domain S-box-containing protein
MPDNKAIARLSAVFDTMHDGVILIDARGTMVQLNPAAERLFGYRAGEAVGQNVSFLMPEPFRQEHDSHLEQYHRSGLSKIIGTSREVVGQRKDGSTFPMEIAVSEAREDGQPLYIGLIHDLTERKRAEDQNAQALKIEAVGQLSGGVAHDFNNLLTVIVGNAEIIGEKLRTSPDLKRLADAILAAGERGAELTQRLLAFGRRQTLQPVQVDGAALFEAMKPILARTLHNNIHVHAKIEKNLRPVFADPSQLQSAILNLALNAQDAMPNGGTLTITSENLPVEQQFKDGDLDLAPGDYVLLTVTDEGVGMTPDVLQRVFEPFFTTKDVGKGSGLGLSMVFGFIKQSNGHVSIHSKPGFGTAVRIYLPAAKAPTERAETPAPMQEEPLAGGSETVLVAEDDPFVRAYAVNCLSSLGYQVVAAANGEDALVKLTESVPVDLLFTDVVMPGIDGWELADRARRLRPGLKVLLTSGYALETLESRGRLHPGTAVLNKPYRKVVLAKRVRDTLDQRP